jgi:hypothetical protein
MNLVLTYYKYQTRHWKFDKDQNITHLEGLCTVLLIGGEF